jgi:hypothetical protein
LVFEMPEYSRPDLETGLLASSPDATLKPVVRNGVAPEGFHATTIYPEYVKVQGECGPGEAFPFRTGRTRGTSYWMNDDRLYDLLEYERENGYVVWVLGPAVVFDFDLQRAMVGLVENGYVDAVFAGDARARVAEGG